MHLALAFAQVTQARGPLFFGSESSMVPPGMLHRLTPDSYKPLGPSLSAYLAGVSRDSGFCVATPGSRDTRVACKSSYLGPLPGGSYQGPPRSGGSSGS